MYLIFKKTDEEKVIDFFRINLINEYLLIKFLYVIKQRTE